jgi:hypothetical protein
VPLPLICPPSISNIRCFAPVFVGGFSTSRNFQIINKCP